MNEELKAFKSELKELLVKYNAEIYVCDNDEITVYLYNNGEFYYLSTSSIITDDL